MATIETGSIVADIRGSVGNEIYSRGPGGLYVKSRTSPAQPASAYRDATQATFTALTQAWSGTLTESQRQTWRQYANTWKTPNRLGRQIQTPGLCHFVKCNFYPHLVTALIPFLTAPPGGPTHIPSFTFTANGSTNQVAIALPPTNYDPLPDELNLYLSIGKEMNAGRNYYSTPWRYSGWNHWNGSVWTNDPWTVNTPWPISAGKKLFTRLVAVLADGETSGHYQCNVIIS